ncbi:hypothetical protein Hanom_Chr07g00665981 [Helianthus anomalus]
MRDFDLIGEFEDVTFVAYVICLDLFDVYVFSLSFVDEKLNRVMYFRRSVNLILLRKNRLCF